MGPQPGQPAPDFHVGEYAWRLVAVVDGDDVWKFAMRGHGRAPCDAAEFQPS
jgi:hypothetical protein